MAAKTVSCEPHCPDPDALVFWLTSTLCALFLLFVPGMIPVL